VANCSLTGIDDPAAIDLYEPEQKFSVRAPTFQNNRIGLADLLLMLLKVLIDPDQRVTYRLKQNVNRRGIYFDLFNF
jgi:hypothetical protein